MRFASVFLALAAALLLVPVAAAQGGNGELRVWTEPQQQTIQVPADGAPAEVAISYKAKVSNITCARATSVTVRAIVVQPPEVPIWANYSFQPNANVTFDLEGDYRVMSPNAEIKAKETRTLRLRWPLAPPNATWVYKLSVGAPIKQTGDCVFNPQLKPQSPGLVGAFLEGGEAPGLVPSLTPFENPTNTSLPTTSVAQAKGGSPAPGWQAMTLGVLAAFAWNRRRRA